MPPVVDVHHIYHGIYLPGGVCRIRVYRPAGFPPVVIATELPENDSTSITNLAEQLAAEVLEAYLPDRAGEDRPFVWIEHYPRQASGGVRLVESFDLVTFSDYRPRQELRAGRWRVCIGEPAWRRLSRAQVELMIGEPLAE